MSIQLPTGVFDIVPQAKDAPWREVHLWQYIEACCRQIAADYAFSEIRTPIFERAELFSRGVGEETDIVSKEMYVFQDRGGRDLALRPEGTASVIRSLICEGNFSPISGLRYFYIGPMFRYERPQAGRFRQHHQFGVEVFGISAPEQDAELISMLMHLYQRLGLPNLKAFVNSLGDKECRNRFRVALLDYLQHHIHGMSEDSQRRFEKNPLRILDSKDPLDQAVVAKAPSILDFLSNEDRDHFLRVQELLTGMEIPYEVSPLLVRGLDYYQRTVFEVTSGQLGAQNTVGGGGRYDGLLEQLGGPKLPSIGFGTGLERIIQLLIKEGLQEKALKPALSVVIVPMDEKARTYSLILAEKLREKNLRILVDFSGKKVKQAVAAAADMSATWLLVLGEKELESRRGMLKYLQDGTQTEVNLEQLDVLVHLVNVRHSREG
jgi:histidyl-tRNA synthetase